jgi:Ca2+-binding RTX toxin-like protein
MPLDLAGNKIGIRVNDNGTLGLINYVGSDYLNPTVPIYNFSIGVNGFSSNAFISNTTNPFGFTLTNTSSSTQRSATLTGSLSGLNITRQFIFEPNSDFVTIRTTLTNNTSTTLNNIALLDNLDPDPAGVFATNNDVNGSLVVATSGVRSIGLFSPNVGVFPSATGLNNFNPYSFLSTIDPNGAAADVGLNLATNVGSLGVGQSVTQTSFLVFGTSQAAVETTGLSIFGTPNNDILRGGLGNDIFIASAGNDTFNGNTGIDIVDYSNLGQAVTLLPAGVINKGSLGTDTIANIERIVAASGFNNGIDASTTNGSVSLNVDLATNAMTINNIPGVGNLNFGVENFVNVSGTANNDIIGGSNANNTLNGGGGNDLFIGSRGNDTINGGDGIDTLDYSNLGAAVTVSSTGIINKGTFGTDTAFRVERFIGASGFNNVIDASTAGGSVSMTMNLATNSLTVNNVPSLGNINFTVENFIDGIGGTNNDTMTGSSANNILNGGAGNDSLDGGAGNDTLIGGSGNDTLIGGTGIDSMSGGTGNDLYFVDNAADIVRESFNGGRDTVLATVSYTLSANVEDMILSGTANLNGTGNSRNNRLFGNDGNNILSGLSGSDRIFGGGGSDTIDGGDDNDFLSGDVGSDALLGGSGNDTLIGVDNTSETAGRAELDTLTGGLGGDLFILGDENIVYYDDGDELTNGASDYALITDFNTAVDTIQLQGTASDYFFGTVAGVTGTLLFADSNSNGILNTSDELIAIIQGSSGLNLTASYFTYV